MSGLAEQLREHAARSTEGARGREEAERARAEAVLAEAGARASAAAPLARLAMEPDPPQEPAAPMRVRLTTWPGGVTRELGVAGPHGPPVRWTGSAT